MNRGPRPTQTSATTPAPSPVTNQSSVNVNNRVFKGLRLASVALLFSGTALVVALVWFFVVGAPTSEAKYIEEDKLQAVFLNGGQVYFGNIKDITEDSMRLSNIFYLRVNQQVQPEQGEQAQANANDISLVKLGCELHRPTNEMVINRDQVIFWENLKDDDAQNTVPGAVKDYVKQYPNGQECEAAPQPSAGNETTEGGESNNPPAQNNNNEAGTENQETTTNP